MRIDLPVRSVVPSGKIFGSLDQHIVTTFVGSSIGTGKNYPHLEESNEGCLPRRSSGASRKRPAFGSILDGRPRQFRYPLLAPNARHWYGCLGGCPLSVVDGGTHGGFNCGAAPAPKILF